MHTFGLLGFPLGHSFSKPYFEEKFKKLKLTDYEFKLFEFSSIHDFANCIEYEKTLIGFSVTSPHKENIISLLNELDPVAESIGAVNCVKAYSFNGSLRLKGFNTDAYGFRQSIKPFLEPHHDHALIIGTGGAAKAVAYALTQIGVRVAFLTRDKSRFPTRENYFSYSELNQELLHVFKLIINTSPAEMLNTESNSPSIPYQFISPSHFCYDLIYQPTETVFLRRCKAQGALIINGIDMLYAQAEKAWEIWNS